MQKIIYRIDEENEIFLKNLTADCYVLSTMFTDEFCKKFTEIALKSEKVVLFYGENAVSYCKKYEADGVVCDFGTDNLKEKMAETRKEIGKNKFIGLFTRNRRHESMLVSEAEPDFVIFRVWNDGFAQLKELTDWYADFFLIQSAAWLMDDNVPESKNLRTDFLMIKMA